MTEVKYYECNCCKKKMCYAGCHPDTVGFFLTDDRNGVGPDDYHFCSVKCLRDFVTIHRFKKEEEE